MSRPIYVIGHRNPDTDSICSAIGYAHLKRALGDTAVPARAGKINAETRYVLERFGMETPVLIPDLYPRARDIMSPASVTIHPDQTIKELGQRMRESRGKSAAVIDEKGSLLGIVSVGDLAHRYFEELEMPDLASAEVTFRGILAVLDGRVEVAGEIVHGAGRWRDGDRVCALLGGGGYAEYAVADARHRYAVDRVARGGHRYHHATVVGGVAEADDGFAHGAPPLP